MKKRSLLCALTVACAAFAVAPAHAATVVDNCSSYEGSGGLMEALGTGGDIVFACDGVIQLTTPGIIGLPTSIDAAGHDVTLDGVRTHRIFDVLQTSLRLSGLRLVEARGSAVRIHGGSLEIIGSHFEGNAATYRDDSANGLLQRATGMTPAGGAIRADLADVTVTGSLFKANFATDADGTTAGLGGAIAMFGGSLSIENSEFTSNTTRAVGLGVDRGSGGAIWVEAGSPALSIAGSTFETNTTGLHGGAVWSGAQSLIVSSSDFTGNATGLPVLAETGGGAIFTTSTTTVSDSAFAYNGTGGLGGALQSHSPTTVTASTFEGNNAGGLLESSQGSIVGMGSGGAIASIVGPTSVADSRFDDNTASRNGGAIFAQGGLAVERSAFEDNGIRGLIVIDSGETGGGAISVDTATIADSIFNRNHANRGNQVSLIGDRPVGGAVSAQQVSVDGSTFSFNAAAGSGGAINADAASIRTSSLSHNVAGLEGGGINAGSVALESSTVAFNVSGAEGGGVSTGEATISNSTLYGNTSGASQDQILNSDDRRGGAVHAGRGTILNATIADNGSSLGQSALVGELTLVNTIVAGDPAGSNCDSGVVDGGHNIDSGSTCGFDAANASMSNTDPMLRGLADNGGPTRTVATHRNSPAIDAGDTTACPARDQRNRARLGACDIGAFENRSV